MAFPIRIVFFGTYTFATTILQGLIDSPFIDVCLVVTRPDQLVGRKKELQPPPVKQLAMQYHIPTIQPEKLKDIILPISHADVGITAQYGAIIPQGLLDFPIKGILNVHTSLLPKYRGASPIQSAILNGDSSTGVTIMKMEAGLDTGPILMQNMIDISPDVTYAELDQSLATLGAETLLAAIPLYMSGELIPIPQDNSKATHCTKISREDGQIDWKQYSAQQIYNMYRAFTPWPGVWTTWNYKRLKLMHIGYDRNNTLEPGHVLYEEDTQRLLVGTSHGCIIVYTVQLEGKTAMSILSFLRGFPSFAQAILS